MITTGLDLIYKELDTLGIPMAPLGSAGNALPSMLGGAFRMEASIGLCVSQGDSSSVAFLQTESSLANSSYSISQTEGATNYSLLDMSPEMYEAFLQAEPISVIMDPGFDVF